MSAEKQKAKEGMSTTTMAVLVCLGVGLLGVAAAGGACFYIVKKTTEWGDAQKKHMVG